MEKRATSVPKTSDVEAFKNTLYSSKIVAAAYSNSKQNDLSDTNMKTTCTLQNFYTGHTSSLKNMPKMNTVSNYFSAKGHKSASVLG